MAEADAHKLDKAIVLYFGPDSIGRPDGARCGACWKFIKTGACCEVSGTIVAEKVCGLYVHGTPFAKDPNFPITQVSQQEAGYGRGDSKCQNCEYMGDRTRTMSPCEEVQGLVAQKGCCNHHDFEGKKKEGESRFAASMKR